MVHQTRNCRLLTLLLVDSVCIHTYSPYIIIMAVLMSRRIYKAGTTKFVFYSSFRFNPLPIYYTSLRGTRTSHFAQKVGYPLEKW